MPSRVLRAEIVESESLARVSEEAELLFYKLILKADDFGRYEGDAELLAAYLYPRRRSISSDEVEARLQELATCDPDGGGPIRFYEVGGARYVWLINWERYRSNSKRGTRSKWPLPLELPPGVDAPADAPPAFYEASNVDAESASEASTRTEAVTDPPDPPDPHSQRRGSVRGVGVSRCRGVEVSEEPTTSPPAPDGVTPQSDTSPCPPTPASRARDVWPRLRAVAAEFGVKWAATPGASQVEILTRRIRLDGLTEDDLEAVIRGYVALRGTVTKGDFNPLEHLRVKTLYAPSNWPDYRAAADAPPPCNLGASPNDERRNPLTAATRRIFEDIERGERAGDPDRSPDEPFPAPS